MLVQKFVPGRHRLVLRFVPGRHVLVLTITRNVQKNLHIGVEIIFFKIFMFSVVI